MKKTWTIAAKELGAYFRSPSAYIILIILLVIFNTFFFMIIDQNREASLRDMFKLMEFMFVFIIPLLTMKTFAEEKRTGTIEFLMTSPTKNTDIVLGKYLGSLIFLSLTILLTTVYYIILQAFSHPDKGAILSGYIGIWLEGALFLAIGLMASSWTKSQTIAAMSSYIILFLLYFSLSYIMYFDEKTQNIIRYIGCWSHIENFSSGLFTLGDLTYFLTGIFFALALTRLSIENRLWK